MTVTYTDRARQSAEDYQLLQRATERLLEAIDGSVKPTSAEWDREEGASGEPVYTLRLRDEAGEAVGRLDPDELRSPGRSSFRVYRVWGDLLQARTDRLLRGLQGTED